MLGDTTLPEHHSHTDRRIVRQQHHGRTPSFAEHIDYPINHPKVQRLIKRFQKSDDELVTAQNLVAFTHGQLSYAAREYAGTVLTALELRRGECTDFADLYTTLARSWAYPRALFMAWPTMAKGYRGFDFMPGTRSTLTSVGTA